MLGRHFLVTSTHLPNVRRYYTICNCIMPGIYEEYLRIIYEAVKMNNMCSLDNTLFTEEDVDFVALTVKNYRRIGGISDLLH